MTYDPEEVLAFWLDEEGPQAWYQGGAELDARIRSRFEGAWEAARDGELSDWRRTARGSLALLLLTDQFSRNMFRGTAKAFSTDAMARDVALRGIEHGYDLQIEGAARQFFYLPLEHSECLADQERAVRLIALRMPKSDTLLHARAHRQIIRTFGRFPFRNEALGRETSAREAAFIQEGGYGGILRALQAAA